MNIQYRYAWSGKTISPIVRACVGLLHDIPDTTEGAKSDPTCDELTVRTLGT